MAGGDECRAVVRDAAVRLLARREHSRLELAGKLGSRGHPKDLIEDVLEALVDVGLQSDERFAQAFVRSALERGQGPTKIRTGLRDRGVDQELASGLLDLGGEDWRRRAAGALVKRFGGGVPEDRADWARRARFLASRGFPSDVVAGILGPLDGLY